MTALSETIAAQADLLESVLAVPVDDAAERIGRSKRLWLVGTGTSQHAAELGALMFGPGKRDARWRSSAAFCGDPPALTAQRRGCDHLPYDRDGVRATSAGARDRVRGRAWCRSPRRAGGGPRPSRPRRSSAPRRTPRVTSRRWSCSHASASPWATGLRRAPAVRAPGPGPRGRAGAGVLDAAPERLLVLAGAGPAAVTAREGALKLREGAQLPAEGYEAEYLLHGTAVPLGTGRRAARDPAVRRSASGCSSCSARRPRARASR